MKTIVAELPADYNLYISSDVHIGSVCVSDEHVNEFVNAVAKDRKGFVCNLGDNIEAITPSDKRFLFSKNLYQTPQQQADRFIELFTPIKRKLLAIGHGNHEATLKNIFNASEYIAKGLDVEYGGESYIMHMRNKQTHQLMHRMYMKHGRGYIGSNAKDVLQQEGNMKAALKLKLMNAGFNDCIAFFMGHIHKFLIVPPTIGNKLYVYTDKHTGKLHESYRVQQDQNANHIPAEGAWYASNGSMMKTYAPPELNYTSYAEEAGYAPAEIGYLKCTIQNECLVNIESIKL